MPDLEPSPPHSALFRSSNLGRTTSPRLPLEILILIVEHSLSPLSQAPETLTWADWSFTASLCRVSKALLPFAQKALYQAPALIFTVHDDSNRSTNAFTRAATSSNSVQFRRTLTEAPHLASLVLKLHIIIYLNTENLIPNSPSLEAELLLLFTHPLPLISLEVAEPYKAGGSELIESVAELLRGAAWLDQLVELKMDYSGDAYSNLLGQLPRLRKLDVGIESDSEWENEPFKVINPLTFFGVRWDSPTLLQSCLIGSAQSLRSLSLVCSLLVNEELPADYWSAFVNLSSVDLEIDFGSIAADHHDEDTEMYSPLAQLPSLGTLCLDGCYLLPPHLPSLHTLHLLLDSNLKTSHLFDYISSNPNPQLKRLGVTNRFSGNKWTAMERFAIKGVCENAGIELLDCP
ncbi:hypothetical protein BCR35DRAFT_127903 [Leucosporidium creatinivorum]|uniref:F-box domain-containing protein n=1 Tax=Leucosporidium creatinivorum TaxID=106004 RepID=A0A1Y2EUW1_9BASI|nr:hypothetical protein BCR35DRAFT_127903 [Leucosporidium creatinivorum]